MPPKVEDETALRQYLLGELPEDERSRLEQALLTEEDLLELLNIAEEELIEAYLYDRLKPGERRDFESNFLVTSERRRKLRFARSLGRYVAAGAAAGQPAQEVRTPFAAPRRSGNPLAWLFRPGPALGFALAALVVVAAAGLWLLAENRRLRASLAEARQGVRPAAPTPDPAPAGRTDEERARAEQAAEELRRVEDERARLERELAALRAGGAGGRDAGPPPQERAQPALAVSLLPGLLREGDDGLKTVTLAPGVGKVRLHLTLITEESYKTYRASLLTDDRSEIHVRTGLRPRTSGGTQSVTFDIAASKLPPGDYVVRLSGTTAGGETDDVGSYSFRVRR